MRQPPASLEALRSRWARLPYVDPAALCRDIDSLPIHTCNPDDFAGIDGLIVVAVPHPDR